MKLFYAILLACLIGLAVSKYKKSKWHKHSVKYYKNSFQSKYNCADGWIAIGKRCYKLFDNSIMLNWADASEYCSNIGAEMPTLKGRRKQRFLLEWIRTQTDFKTATGSAIWTSHRCHRGRCYLSSGQVYSRYRLFWGSFRWSVATIIFEEENCADLNFQASQYNSDMNMLLTSCSDERRVICERPACRKKEFMCSDGSGCVPEKWTCDKIKDCDDASDELPPKCEPEGPTCGGTFTSDSGNIILDFNGGNYPNNLECVWFIKSSKKMYIKFEFTYFSTESYDILKVYSGNSIKKSKLVAEYSGENNNSILFIPNNMVTLKFVSDDSKNEKGFKIRYTAGTAETFDTTAYVNINMGSIEDFDYETQYIGHLLEYKFTASTTSVISFWLNQVKIGKEGFIKFYDGETAKGTLILTLTYGMSFNQYTLIMAREQFMFIQIKAGIDKSIQTKLVGKYVEGCDITIDNAFGSLTSPGFQYGNYPNNLNCTITFKSNQTKMSHVVFDFVDLEYGYDYLEINNVKTVWSETDVSTVLYNLSYNSTSDLVIRFYTDYSITKKGFSLSYSIDCDANTPFGSETSYDCPTGQYIKGSYPNSQTAPIKCSIGGFKIPNSYDCEAKSCGNPPNANYVYYEKFSSTKFGSQIQPRCIPGTKSNDGQEQKMTCSYYGWTAPPTCEEITCPRPNIPQDSAVDFTPSKFQYNLGDRVNFKCPNGNTVSGPKYAICQFDGSFSEIPNCRGCSRPKLSDQASISPNVLSLSIGQTVNIVCKKHFEPKGANSTTCKSDGTLSVPKLECQDINECVVNNPCPFDICINTYGGHICECQPGYIKGKDGYCNDVNECQINKQICDQMCVNSFGSYTCECHPGYILYTSESEKAYYWNDLKDDFKQSLKKGRSCIPLPCPLIPETFMYTVKYTSKTVYTTKRYLDFGTKVTVTASTGYWISETETQYTTQCVMKNNNATWSIDIKTFIPGKCPANPTVENGIFLAPNMDYLAKANLSCNAGYDVDGSGTAQCVAQITKHIGVTYFWVTDSRCLPKKGCPQLTAPPNSELFYKTAPGALAAYSCNSDYFLIGQSIRVCNSDSTWSGEEPTCVAAVCTLPSLGSQVAFESKSAAVNFWQIGSVAEFVCSREGYEIVGKNKRQCIPNDRFQLLSPVDPDKIFTVYGCQDSVVQIGCPVETRIRIIYSNYGYEFRKPSNCENDTAPTKLCGNSEVTSRILRPMCNGQTRCSLPVFGSVFGAGDSQFCEGKSAYLEVAYQCDKPMPQKNMDKRMTTRYLDPATQVVRTCESTGFSVFSKLITGTFNSTSDVEMEIDATRASVACQTVAITQRNLCMNMRTKTALSKPRDELFLVSMSALNDYICASTIYNSTNITDYSTDDNTNMTDYYSTDDNTNMTDYYSTDNSTNMTDYSPEYKSCLVCWMNYRNGMFSDICSTTTQTCLKQCGSMNMTKDEKVRWTSNFVLEKMCPTEEFIHKAAGDNLIANMDIAPKTSKGLQYREFTGQDTMNSTSKRDYGNTYDLTSTKIGLYKVYNHLAFQLTEFVVVTKFTLVVSGTGNIRNFSITGMLDESLATKVVFNRSKIERPRSDVYVIELENPTVVFGFVLNIEIENFGNDQLMVLVDVDYKTVDQPKPKVTLPLKCYKCNNVRTQKECDTMKNCEDGEDICYTKWQYHNKRGARILNAGCAKSSNTGKCDVLNNDTDTTFATKCGNTSSDSQKPCSVCCSTTECNSYSDSCPLWARNTPSCNTPKAKLTVSVDVSMKSRDPNKNITEICAKSAVNMLNSASGMGLLNIWVTQREAESSCSPDMLLKARELEGMYTGNSELMVVRINLEYSVLATETCLENYTQIIRSQFASFVDLISGISAASCPQLTHADTQTAPSVQSIMFDCPKLYYPIIPGYRCLQAKSLEKEISQSADTNLMTHAGFNFTGYFVWNGSLTSRTFDINLDTFITTGLEILVGGNYRLQVTPKDSSANFRLLSVKLYASMSETLKSWSIYINQNNSSMNATYTRVIKVDVTDNNYPVTFAELKDTHFVTDFFIMIEVKNSMSWDPLKLFIDVQYSNCTNCGNTTAEKKAVQSMPNSTPPSTKMPDAPTPRTIVLSEWGLLSGNFEQGNTTTSWAAIAVITPIEVTATLKDRIILPDYTMDIIDVTVDTTPLEKTVNLTWDSEFPSCVDTMPPQFIGCNSPQKYILGPFGPRPVDFYPPLVEDNSGEFPNLTLPGIREPYMFSENMTVSYLATDRAGNLANCTIEIVMVDVTPPTIICPPRMYYQHVYLNATNITVVNPIVNATDASGKVTITFGIAEGTPVRLNEPMWNNVVATDASGNKATCSFQHTVFVPTCNNVTAKTIFPSTMSKIKVLSCSETFGAFQCRFECEPGYGFQESGTSTEKYVNCGDGIFENVPFCSKIQGDVIYKYNLVVTGGSAFCPLNTYSVPDIVQVINTVGNVECLKNSTRFSLSYSSNSVEKNTDSQSTFNLIISLHYSYVVTNATEIDICSQSLTAALVDLTIQMTTPKDSCDVVTSNKLGNATQVLMECPSGFMKFSLSKTTPDYCLVCQAGQFYNSNTSVCESCPIGTYQPYLAQTTCQPCPQGTDTTSKMSKSASDCRIICQPGTFSDGGGDKKLVGLDPCQECPVNTYSLESRSKNCTSCPNDTFTDGPGAFKADHCKGKCRLGEYSVNGMTPCFKCPTNSYQDMEGQMFCKFCPNNTATPESGATNVSLCSASINFCQPNPCYNNVTCINHPQYAECVCPKGYRGPRCEIMDDLCASTPCRNDGNCTANATTITCTCPAGYEGNFCEKLKDICSTNPCFNEGFCLAKKSDPRGYSCWCPILHPGPHCEQNRTWCDTKPCYNGGTCANVNDVNAIRGYVCNCTGTNYGGLFCTESSDPCLRRGACLNGGTCNTTGYEQYSCGCSKGWTGKRCEIDIDECNTTNPCKNNGTCLNLAGDFKCNCPIGFEGELCDIPIKFCSNDSCTNNGTCVEELGGFSCNCSEGYEGQRCELITNNCNKCYSNGTQWCVNGFLNYTCNCMFGYTGFNCSEIVKQCNETTCSNNGNCTDLDNGLFQCTCPTGFTGDRCEINIDDCSPNPCYFGNCTDGINEYNCTCSTGYSGDNCEIINDECAKVNCSNNATCYTANGKANCKCLPGYSGDLCQIDIDDCLNGPCSNDGNCTDQVNGFSCVCPAGYTGDKCEVTACANTGDQECKHTSTCVNTPGIGPGYQCNCANGFDYIKEICVENSIPCENATYCQNNGECLNFTTSGLVCKCPPKFNGFHCEKEKSTDFDLLFKTSQTGISTTIGISNNETAFTIFFYVRINFNDVMANIMTISIDNRTTFVFTGHGASIYCDGSSKNISVTYPLLKWIPVALVFNSGKIDLRVSDQPVNRNVACTDLVKLSTSIQVIIGSMDQTKHKSFVGEVNRFNLLKIAIDQQKWTTLIQNISYVDYEDSIILWTAMDQNLLNGVERRQPSTNTGQTSTVCPPEFTGPKCDVKIDKIPPVVKFCPTSSIIIKTDNPLSAIAFKEPEFVDDTGVFKIEKNYAPGTVLAYGEYEAIYTAQDAAENKATCTFTLVIKSTSVCEDPEIPNDNTKVLCTNVEGNMRICKVSCINTVQFRFTTSNVPPFYTCDEMGVWKPALEPKVFPSCEQISTPGLQLPVNGTCNAENLKKSFMDDIEKLNQLSRGKICGSQDEKACETKYKDKVTVNCPPGNRRKRNTDPVIASVTAPDDLNTIVASQCSSSPTTCPASLTCQPGHVIVDDACVACGKGKIPNSGKTICEDCAKGSYNDQSGQSTCTACDSETTTPGTGATTKDDCIKTCLAGQHFNDPDCLPCQAGTYSNAGATQCLSCGNGQMSNADKSGCQAVPMGSMVMADGSIQSAPKGFYMQNGVKTPCPSGYTTKSEGATSESDCNIPKCPQGQYGDSASDSCKSCPQSTYNANVDVDISGCISCGPDKTTDKEGSTSESDCKTGLVDECSVGAARCHKPGATCTDTPSSYTCACITPNWVGDGKTCACGNDWAGDNCDKKRVSDLTSGQLIGIIVGCILAGLLIIIVIVVVVCCCLKKQKSKKLDLDHYREGHSNNAYTNDSGNNVRLVTLTTEERRQYLSKLYRANDFE